MLGRSIQDDHCCSGADDMNRKDITSITNRKTSVIRPPAACWRVKEKRARSFSIRVMSVLHPMKWKMSVSLCSRHCHGPRPASASPRQQQHATTRHATQTQRLAFTSLPALLSKLLIQKATQSPEPHTPTNPANQKNETMSSILNHNKPNRRPPSQFLGRTAARPSARGSLNRRVAAPNGRVAVSRGASVGAVDAVNDGGGMVQLQRQKAVTQQQQLQQGGGKQETLKEGQINMDEGETVNSSRTMFDFRLFLLLLPSLELNCLGSMMG